MMKLVTFIQTTLIVSNYYVIQKQQLFLLIIKSQMLYHNIMVGCYRCYEFDAYDAWFIMSI